MQLYSSGLALSPRRPAFEVSTRPLCMFEGKSLVLNCVLLERTCPYPVSTSSGKTRMMREIGTVDMVSEGARASLEALVSDMASTWPMPPYNERRPRMSRFGSRYELIIQVASHQW